MTSHLPTVGVPTVDMTDLKVTLARVDERVAALQRDAEARERVADARHQENRSTLALTMTRPEIEGIHQAMDGRVKALENFKGTLLRYALALAGCVIAGLALLGKLAGAGLHHLVP